MSTPIEILWRQALKTFTGRGSVGYKFCQNNFDKLHGLMNNIIADDVKVDKKILDYVENNSAPMCVINVYENQDITIAIFLLKHGVTLPLHDHPGMHGLLKVICGTVKIDNYSMTKNFGNNIQSQSKIMAYKHSPIIIKNNDCACVLTPNLNNLHQITCVNGPAAFLDVLSPPYRVYMSDNSVIERPCTFFKQTSTNEEPTSSDANSSTLVNLMVIQQPPNFYSESLEYLGEPLE